MADVDSLGIKIEADVRGAVGEIDKIISGVSSIATALKKIDTTAITSAFREMSGALGKMDTKVFSDMSKSAQEAAREVKKVTETEKKGAKAKITFDTSAYRSAIKELSAKFSKAGSDFKPSGSLTDMEKQAEKLSAKLDDLTRKEEKIISVGKISPEGTMFTNLQYDIAETVNKLDKLGDAIASTAKQSKDLSNIKINRWDEGVPKVNAKTEKPKVSMIPETSTQYNPSLMTSAFGEAAKNIKNYEQIAQQFGDVAQKSLSGMSATAEASKQKTDSLGNKVLELREKLKSLESKGLNFGDAEFDKTYSELKNAESKLEEYKKTLLSAKKSSISFSDTISKSFKKMANSIKKMVSKAVSSLGRLGRSLVFHRKNANGLSGGILGIGKSASKTVASLGNLTKQIAAASGVYLGLYGVIRALKGSIDFASSLTEVQNVIDVTFGKSKKIIEDFAKTSIQQFGLSQLSAKQTAGRFQSMGVALGLPQKEMANMSVELTKLSADLASFYDVSQSETAKSLQSVFTGTTMPMRKYGVDLTQATLEEWAHKRGIDAKMKSMSQAEKMMIRYQYVMESTGAAQGDFARTINSWHNQITLLKENFRELGGVIGTGIINAIKPVVQAINSVMGQVISFSKTVVNALGKIFGWTYEEGGGATNPAEDLAEGMEDVSDSTDKATKKQKEFNKQLSKLDELNNYTKDKNKDKDKGVGSGDLSGLGEGGYGGEWKSGESVIKKFKSEIDNLYELGQTIGDALKKAMDSIDWDGVYKKAEKFGTGLANFLNGLVETPGLFSSIGTTIAGGLNTALHFLDSFGKTFKWSAFGKGIANGINAFFKTFDFGLLASTFNTWANGILTTMIEAVQGVEWKTVAEKIVELINGIDASGISWNLGKLVNSLANAFYQLVSEKSTWTSLGTKIADGINGFFSGMNDVDPETGLTGFQALGKSISESISGIAGTITTALKGVDWTTVGQSIGDFIASIDFGKVAWDLTKLAANLFSAIVDAVSGFVEKAPLESAIVGLFVGLKLTGLGGKISTAISTALAGKNLSLGKIAIGLGLGAATLKLANEGKWTSAIASGITAFLTAKTFTGSTKLSLKIAAVTVAVAAGFKLGKVIGDWVTKQLATEDMSQYSYDFKFTDLFSYDLEEWKQGAADMVVDFQETLSEKKEEVLQAIADWLVDSGIADIPSKIVGFFSDALARIKKIWSKATIFFSGIWTGITNVFKNAGDWFKSIFSTAWGNIKGAWNNTKTFFSNIWNGITNVFNNVGSWFKDKFSKGWGNVKSAWGNTKTFFSGVWSNIKGAFGNIADWFKDKFSKAWEEVKKVFSTGGRVFDGIKDGILNGLKDVVNGLIRGINKVIETPFNGLNAALEKIRNVSIAGAKPFHELIPKIDVPQIRTLATGGFPEDGWFRASHGEYLGKFDNGQSVVANNKQITDGISDAVHRGNQESVMLMRQEISMLQRQNDLLLGILQKETGISKSEVFNAVRDEDNAFYKRNGHGAFAY